MARIPDPPSHPIRCGPFRVTRRGLARAAVLIAVHAIIIFHIIQWKSSGSTLTPVEPSEAATTIETGFVNTGFLFFAAVILLTLVFGRFFCGWACHVVAYQDFCAWILKKLKIPPMMVRSRLLMIVPFYAAFDMFAWPSLSRLWAGAAPAGISDGAGFQGWALTTPDLWERFPTLGIAILTIAVDGFLIVWWLGSKGFCNYGCPYGAFFSIADRFAPGKIRVTDACNGCGHCTAVCTSNVRVHEEVRLYKTVTDSSCMKCFDCISTCPNDALFYGFGKPAVATPKPAAAPKKHYDYTWGGEIALVILFSIGMFAFRGLYSEVPFLLALGLSSMFAFGTVAFYQLIRNADFRFQHHSLKLAGKLSGAGWLAIMMMLAGALLTAHSAAVQYYSKSGERLLLTAQRLQGGERIAARDESYQHLQTAEQIGLFPNGKLQFQLASIAFNRGEAGDAERRVRLATEYSPRMIDPWLQLSGIQLSRGDREGARATLERGAAENPGSELLKSRLQALAK
ncbi:MAG: 4Fe-4S binding protein [Planctomycetota bacterium]